MTRTPRRYQIAEGETYHVVARGNNKMKLFRDDLDYRLYLSLIPEAKMKFDVKLFHYMLMPNHVHLMVRLGEQGISDFMHAMQSTYAKHYGKRYAFVGHIWQARFISKRIDSDGYMFMCGNYIEINAYRAGLVEKPEDWPYCSYRYYAFGEPNSLIDTDPLYEDLGLSREKRQELYRKLARRPRTS